MIEEINIKDELLAIIVRASFHEEGIKFFTPNQFSQQLAYMSHKKGKEITPHIHNQSKESSFYPRNSLHQERKTPS